ncbi:hypothetical protein BT96DRAFT_942997 [Gymnopus androsaceus JB14]|uniref:Uncharacterized protein n=1 Tax=Gymnopus androsaceus JB14 TaxID=1447944 RepID=A0A6A4H8Q2_9AGAR|nr:hypothetical protein BT96DRAFT_942997 [Gymnopus androsaceus JB14]
MLVMEDRILAHALILTDISEVAETHNEPELGPIREEPRTPHTPPPHARTQNHIRVHFNEGNESPGEIFDFSGLPPDTPSPTHCQHPENIQPASPIPTGLETSHTPHQSTIVFAELVPLVDAVQKMYGNSLKVMVLTGPQDTFSCYFDVSDKGDPAFGLIHQNGTPPLPLLYHHLGWNGLGWFYYTWAGTYICLTNPPATRQMILINWSLSACAVPHDERNHPICTLRASP